LTKEWAAINVIDRLLRKSNGEIMDKAAIITDNIKGE